MNSNAALPKTYLVVLALLELGGESDLEHIAVKAWQLFPQQFCWDSFPDFPDKDAVRVHLSEAKKPAYGALVADRDLRKAGSRTEGVATKRFALTEAGIVKAEEVRALVTPGASITAEKNSIDYKRLVAPILDSEAYRKFVTGIDMRQISRDDFLLAFLLFADAEPLAITGRLGRAQAVVGRLPASPERQHLADFIQRGRNTHEL